MTQKLSKLPAPALAGVIRERSTRSAIAEIKNCYFDGADMIDLHVSCLEHDDEETLRDIFQKSPLPILALNYNMAYDWKSLMLTEEERVESLLRAVRAGAAGIDMQGYTFHAPSKTDFFGEDKYSFTKGKPKEIVTDNDIIKKQCALIDEVHSMGAEVLLSCHPGTVMHTDAVVELALFLEKRQPDIIKIVTAAKSLEDAEEAKQTMLALKREVKTPIAYHANGSAGIPTRILNPLLGGHIAFCVDRYTDGSTMEQIDLKTAKAAVAATKRLCEWNK